MEKKIIGILDNMAAGFQIIDQNWRYTYVNDTVAKQGHTTKEELQGKTMMEAYPGIEKTEMFTVLSRCMKNREPEHMENEFTYPSGEKGWFELSIQPVSEGILILSIDITEFKRAEAEIRNMAKFPSENPNPVCRITKDGTILYSNKAAQDIKCEMQKSKKILPKKFHQSMILLS